MGMDFARPEDLNPAGPLAHRATFPAAIGAGNIDFHRGLGEGEIGGTKPNFPLLAEELFHEELKGTLEVGQRDAFIDDQAFDLTEFVRMGHIIVIAPVAFAWADHPNRFLAALRDHARKETIDRILQSFLRDPIRGGNAEGLAVFGEMKADVPHPFIADKAGVILTLIVQEPAFFHGFFLLSPA